MRWNLEQMGRTMEKIRAAVQLTRVRGVVLLALFAATLAIIATATAQSAAGSWTLKAPLPAARGEVAAVTLDGKLHALGGSVNGTAGPYHDEYDPGTNTWRARAPLPEGRDHLAVATVGGKIYAFGGFTASVHKGGGTDAVEYDPANDRWRGLPPMQVARGSAGAAVVDGKIHVIGGRRPRTVVRGGAEHLNH